MLAEKLAKETQGKEPCVCVFVGVYCYMYVKTSVCVCITGKHMGFPKQWGTTFYQTPQKCRSWGAAVFLALLHNPERTHSHTQALAVTVLMCREGIQCKQL